jgi:hypothetical protein
VWVEAMAVLRLVGAVRAIAVHQAGMGLRQVSVPDLVGVFRQGEPGDLAPAGGIEQAKIDSAGVGGEDSEIDAEAIPSGAERVRHPRQQSIGKAGHELQPSGASIMVESGGRTRSSDCGSPCDGTATVPTAPALPMSLPP